mgnify:CR=1 FL=1
MAAAAAAGEDGGVTAASVTARLARDINCVSDSDKFKRKRALVTLSAALFDGAEVRVQRPWFILRLPSLTPTPPHPHPHPHTQAPPFEVAAAVLTVSLLKPATAALADPAELVRDAAVALFTRALAAQVAAGGHALYATLLPALLPTLTARVGKTPFGEESEEQRLKLAVLLNALLAAPPAAAAVRAGLPAIVDVLVALAGDAYPAVKLESAKGVAVVAGVAHSSVHPYVRALATSQVAALGHQRGPVRLAALDALAAVVPAGAEGLPRLLADTLLPAFAAARHDRTPSVRRALASTAGSWLTALPPFALAGSDGFEPTLLYHLAGLAADEAPEVAMHAVEALEASAAELTAAAAAPPPAAPPAAALAPDLAVAAHAAAVDAVAAMSLAGGGIAPPPAHGHGHGHAHAASPSLPPELRAQLPPPFAAHAVSPATTAYLAPRLHAVMPLVLAGLKEWTARSRVFAAGALRSLLVLAPASLTHHLGDVIAALCAGSRDDDADARRLLGDCSRLLGIFIPPDAQLGVLIPQLRGEVSGLANGQHYAAALAVLAAALSSMTPASLAPHMALVADTLAAPALVDDDPPTLRPQLAGALFSLVRSGVPAAGAAVGASSAPPTRRLVRTVSCDDDDADSAAARAAAVGAVADAALDAAAAAAGTLGGGSVVEPRVMDDVLLTVLRLADAGASDDVVALATETARMLAHRTHHRHTAAAFAAAAHRLVPRLAADAAAWSRAHIDRRAFDALVRVARPALAGASTPDSDALTDAVTSLFVVTLAPSRDPELRLAMLASLDALIVGDASRSTRSGGSGLRPAARGAAALLAASDLTASPATETASATAAGVRLRLDVPLTGAGAGGGGGSDADTAALRRCVVSHTVSHAAVDAAVSRVAPRLIREALLPNLVWRVGLVPATIRKVALACLLSLLRGGFVTQDGLLAVWSEARPVLAGCLADDDAATRHMATSTLGYAFPILHRAVDDVTVHTLYTELLKRLDDSNDPVRCAACTALGALATAAPPALLSGGSVHYVVDALLVHLDDAAATVQAAALDCAQRWVRLDAPYAANAVRIARARARHVALFDRLSDTLLPLLPPPADVPAA